MPTPRTEQWLSLPAAAKQLGRSAPTVQKWALMGRLPYITVSGRMAFDPSHVAALAKKLARGQPQGVA